MQSAHGHHACQDTCERLHTVRSRRQRQRVSDNHTTPDQLFRDRLVSSVLSITTENNSKQRERCSGRHNAPGLCTAVWHACGRCLCTEAADVMFVNDAKRLCRTAFRRTTFCRTVLFLCSVARLSIARLSVARNSVAHFSGSLSSSDSFPDQLFQSLTFNITMKRKSLP